MSLLSYYVWAEQQADSIAPITIVHSGTHSESDYTLQLLKQALSAADGKYKVQALGYFPPRGRDFAMMEKKEGIDIMWGSAREDREARFRTIRIPIFKGLIGWRIPLLMQHNEDLFKSVTTIEELRLYQPGQHFSWTDTRILKDNGIEVFEVNNHGTIMDMLVKGKFDYFPRAVIEIADEYEQNKERGVIIDEQILLIYPTAYYFYVHKDNMALAENLTKGLNRIIASGEMDSLFDQHFGAVIRQLDIKERQIFKLNNRFLPEGAPLDKKELWLDPNSLPQNNHKH